MSPEKDYFVHESAYVDEPCEIGKGTKIWHYSHIMKDVRIGENCIVGQNVFIASGVVIGNNVKIQNNVSIYTGEIIEDDVFLGPSCVLTNVTNPRSQIVRHDLYEKTIFRRGATVGANATIVCGVELGRYSFIAAGAVVTKDVPDYSLVRGVPARHVGWIGRHGIPLTKLDGNGIMVCPESDYRYKEVKPGVVRCLDLDESVPLPPEKAVGKVLYSDIKKENSHLVSNRKIHMQVPLLDLKAQYVTIKNEVLAAVSEVLELQRYIGGPKVAELEEKIAALSDCKYAVGVSSGTDAILNSLMSLNIGPGDEVITTPFTFFATVGCIVRTGAKPVFVDIDSRSFNINPELIESAVTEKTKAIMPVHLFGQMADMDPIMEIANKYNLAVIEDAAQSITSTYKGKKAGSIGTVGCFSFFPSKNLGAAGDGGMVVTNDEKLYNRLTIMRNHGANPKYYHKFVGSNFRLDPIQAAVLLVKLPHLDKWSQARRRNAVFYNEKFAGTIVKTPYINPDCKSIYNQYVIRVPKRDQLVAHLKKKGIGCEIYYPQPMHLQDCFRNLRHRKGDFPEAEKASTEVLAIPIYPELTDEMTDYVAEAILSFLG